MKVLIPEAALQQHIAVLGKTGSGKTFAAKAAIVEPLLEQRRRVSVVDPTGAWWGLRSSRDGKGPGFQILVLGGDHGDLPLPANGGVAVARLITEQGVNLVADTSKLTVGESARWFIDFGGELYRSNRTPVHLVIDEAHNFAPQGKVPDPDTGKMLHAANRLASGGRSRGIRLTLITQRPQKLHKDTLTSADTLVAMRMLAPHDRMAVEDWIKGCGDPAQGKEVLNSLAGLKRGEGWIWYPEGAHLIRTRFPEIRTFDSSATPEDGHQIDAPKGAASMDLAEIRAALEEAVKEAEANDPKLLRAEIARLNGELAKAKAPKPATAAVDPRSIEEAERRGYAAGLRAVQPIADRLSTLALGITETVDGFQQDLKRLQAKQPEARVHTYAPAPAPRAPVTGSGDGELTKAERQILTALAQHSPQALEQDQLAILAGYAPNAGHFKNTIGGLRSRGLVTSGWPIQILEPGVKVLGAFDPLPRGPQLLAYWKDRLAKAERLLLEAAAEAWPNALTKGQLAARAGYEANAGHFKNSLGRLRTMRLLVGRSDIKASEAFFDG